MGHTATAVKNLIVIYGDIRNGICYNDLFAYDINELLLEQTQLYR